MAEGAIAREAGETAAGDRRLREAAERAPRGVGRALLPRRPLRGVPTPRWRPARLLSRSALNPLGACVAELRERLDRG